MMDNQNNKKYSCEYYSKKFSRKSTLDRHQINSCEKMKEQGKKLFDTITEMKKEISKLEKQKSKIMNNEMNISQKQCNSNNHNTNTNNSNNKIVINNTFNINGVGKENVLSINESEFNEVFKKEISGLITFVKVLNFNERLPENHNFCSTSLEGKYIHTYNPDEIKIENTGKKYFSQELISNTIDKMEILFNANKDKLSKNKKNQINETIQTLKEIKTRKATSSILVEMTRQLQLLSYNNKDTVLKTWNMG
jgi:cell division protein FtsB